MMELKIGFFNKFGIILILLFAISFLGFNVSMHDAPKKSIGIHKVMKKLHDRTDKCSKKVHEQFQRLESERDRLMDYIKSNRNRDENVREK